MIPRELTDCLTEVLRGECSANRVRESLRIQDDSGAKVAEFDNFLRSVAPKIPGITLDFEKLLENDPIECDPLIAHGNLAILRLDALYYQAFEAWTRSGGDLHRFKRVTKAENPATYSDRTEKHERTDENYPPDAQLLNQAVNIVLAGFRIEATLTHRRDQLSANGGPKSPECANPDSRDTTRRAPSQSSSSQPEALARNAASANTIDDMEDLDPSFDLLDEIKPIDGKISLIRGVNKIGILKGYDEIHPLIKTTDYPSRAPCSDSSTPVSGHANNLTAAKDPAREAGPITNSDLSANSAPPRETNSAAKVAFRSAKERENPPSESTFRIPAQDQTLFAKAPPFHKRE
jgi:hypothetical protein